MNYIVPALFCLVLFVIIVGIMLNKRGGIAPDALPTHGYADEGDEELPRKTRHPTQKTLILAPSRRRHVKSDADLILQGINARGGAYKFMEENEEDTEREYSLANGKMPPELARMGALEKATLREYRKQYGHAWRPPR